ncbi:bone morphogenetic protein 15-like [Rhinatrema bivittatum]|uniref:bone morphogenetic protein 15-like n=1 Tax=Rhinatrema bivittatum TaxID=194408 RepID=UPI00112B3018|nr:bone morphogenetic protein 15-like [Rhinatrema bivittatum]
MLLTAAHYSLLCGCLVALASSAQESRAGSPALPLIRALSERLPAAPPLPWRRRSHGQHFQYMMSLYQQWAEKDGRPREDRKVGSDTVRLLRPQRSSAYAVQGPWHIRALKFHLQALPKVAHLVRAAAVCSRTWSMGDFQFFCKMELLPGSHVTSKPSFTDRNIYASHERFSDEKWVELDITSHVQPLIEDSKNNLLKHFYLHHVCSVAKKIGSQLSRQEWKKMASLNIPFLLLYFNDTQKNSSKAIVEHTDLEEPALEKDFSTGLLLSRKTRQVGSIGLDLPSFHQKSSIVKNQCSLHSFRVSFQQLGWDHWIIAPHKYNPKYCKGDCPRILRYGYNSPNHAIVQNFINELVDQNVPRPSCVPYKYSPISVLMIEPNGSILYKEYENMIAESCTCR